MEVKETGFEGLLEIIPSIYQDSRGWFFEFYNEDTFSQHNLNYRFVQQNHSFSLKGSDQGTSFSKPTVCPGQARDRHKRKGVGCGG
jgi:dTDP-4-dehydrorhamnose 3,5-epimerase